MASRILIIDDQAAVCTALQVLFDVHGLETLVARTPAAALELITTEDIGVVIQDMNFSAGTTSGTEGIELVRKIRHMDPDLPVILMTAWTSLETAVQLVKEGASDYIQKPWDDRKLVNNVRNLLRLREVSQENARLRASGVLAREQLAKRQDLRGIVYASPRMHEVVLLATKVAGADVPVMVTGANGAGKEQVAEIIQANSRRRGKPFVKVNAGGLPEQLLDAELFGAEAGSFTGATKLRIGRFEEANGGTLFLDEIGNLSLAGQMKLLRVLQLGEYQRLGSNVTRKTDVRIISATNLDMARAIREGTFREDLFFRLAVIEIDVPPLRQRPEDIVVLAQHFLHQFRDGDEPLVLGAQAERALVEHDWPGNVRELQNRIRRAVLVRKDATLQPADLGLTTPEPPGSTVREPGDEVERASIEQALRETGGVVSRAAARLGLSRQAFYRRMERLGLGVGRRTKE